MPRALLHSALIGTVFFAAVSTCVLPASADDKPADRYTETASVLSTISKHGHFYQVATDNRVYLFLCTKVKSIQFGEPECKLDGKPIATGDSVHFRVEGDWAYMPPVSGESMEEKLRILATELKVTPPVPAAASATSSTTGNAAESAVVVGTGTHVKGQKGGSWSTNPSPFAPAITTASPASPVMATAPVMAVPVTGGPPVMVTPVGPTTGGIVTGVPVTGGPPITAIPTAPVTGVPVGGAPAGRSTVTIGGAAPQWVHILRIQTAGKIYQLECSSRPCTLGSKEIALGDSVTLRVDKKHAYLSSNSQGSATEQEYKLLEVTDLATAPATAPDAKQH